MFQIVTQSNDEFEFYGRFCKCAKRRRKGKKILASVYNLEPNGVIFFKSVI